MAAREYDEDYDALDDDEEVVEQSHADEEDDWGLFSSSSPSSSSPARASVPAPAPAPAPAKRNRAPASSPQCSMDDDSSTEGEEVDTARSKRRAATLPQPTDHRQSQATTLQKRRAQIKELQIKYQQECLSLCRSLLHLQRQWRQELEDPVPGLISFDHLMQEQATKQREISVSKLDTQMQRFVPKFQASSTVTPNVQNAAITATDSSLRRDSKPPLRRKLPWRSNEREAIRRGILMFGVGRSEKVRGVMRGSVKHLQHGLGDIADCSWEFVRACSAHADVKETAFVENLLRKAEDLGIEAGPEVSERVGQWEKVDKLGGVWLKRIKLLDSLGHVIRLCASPATQEIAYNAIDSLGDTSALCEWWNRESDLALLAGTYEHGFGNYEALRMDEQFGEAFGPSWDQKGSRERVSGGKGLVSNCHDQNTSRRFFDHDLDAELIARDSSCESSWPDTNLLTRRLKRLVEHLSRINELEVDIEKGSGKKVKHGQIWSKREKVNFLRMLFTWGVPVIPGQGGQVSWQFFKDRASVRPLKSKKDSSLEACYDELMKEMARLLEGSELHESGSADHAGSSDESDDKGHSEERSPQGPAILTHKTAGRLKERLELLDTLRQASQLFSEDWRHVGLLVQQSHNLPSWWQSGSHDRQLVMGVLKHGFGNWDAIFMDDTYSFKVESEREKARRGLTPGEDVDSLWDSQKNEEPDEFLKATKGKRSFSAGASSFILPCPKSCVKRLRFIASILRRHLQKHYKIQSKGLSF